MLILVIGIGATLALIDGANARTLATKQREGERPDARGDRGGTLGAIPPAQPDSAKTTIQAIPGLADTTPLTTAWTVERRKTVYTVSLSVCSVDDDQDGLGDLTGGNYLVAEGGTADRNPDDYKRATVTVSWKSGNVTKSIRQAGLVNNEASSAGPAVEIISQTPGGTGPPAWRSRAT